MAFHLAKLRELHSAFQYTDIATYALALVGLLMAALALEVRISRLLAFFDPSKEVLVGIVQIPEG